VFVGIRRTVVGQLRLILSLWPLFATAGLSMTSLPLGTANSVVPRADAPVVGGSFMLVDQNGHTVTDETYRGKWLLVYFGYTHCPDACPMALSNIDTALEQLDPVIRARLQPIFVTVDPERDTPAVMKDYVGAFPDARIVGLSGTREQVAMIEKAYRIFVQRHDAHDGEYSMDHTSVIHIVDPTGRFAGLVSDLMGPERLAARLRQLVN
jgi:protein SCO1/2